MTYSPTSKFELHCQVEQSEISIIDFLAKNCGGLSKQKLKYTMQSGAVWLTRGTKTERVRRAKRILKPLDEVHIYYDEDILYSPIVPAQLIADEIAYSVWNKPSGMFSQGSKWGDHTAICRWVEQVGLPQRPTFLVHRLDRATSGLIIVAHQKKIAAKLAQLFEKRQVEKHYRANVWGEIADALTTQPIEDKIEGKSALTKILRTHYQVERQQTQLLLKIETGRKHQIRIHLSKRGYPIVGDRLYGDKDRDCLNIQRPNLQLQSCYLAFECPISLENKTFCLDVDDSYPL